jgi:DNA polymerase
VAEKPKTIRAEAAAHLRALADLGVAELRLRPGPDRAAEPRTNPTRQDEPSAVQGPGRAPRPEPARRERADVAKAALQEALFGGAVVPAGEGEPAALLERLRLEELGDCTRCKLSQGRNTIVFGSGNPSAALMFVGEGPGADEDLQGLPFVGRAGQLLTKMIEAMVVGGGKLRREEVYIANIIKCRPPGNRDPEPEEIAACEGFLFGQIEVIRPKVIIALGAFAARTLLRSKAPISALRGRFHEYRGTLLMPTFHPAYILRNYTEETRRTVYEDLKKAAAELDRLAGRG